MIDETSLSRRESFSEDEYAKNCGIADLNSILSNLNSNIPELIISSITQINTIVSSGLYQDIISNYIYDIVKSLNNLFNYPDPKVQMVSSESLRNIFKESPLLSFGGPKYDFFRFFIELVHNQSEFASCLSVLDKVLNKDSAIKYRFIQIGGLDLLRSIPIENLSLECLISFASITAICIRPDFPNMSIDLVSPLLLNLIRILENPQLFHQAVLTQCVRGCYYFVMNSSWIDIFIENNYHLLMLNAFGYLESKGKVYVASALSYCYYSNNYGAKIANETPLNMYTMLLNTTEICEERIDISISISNICDSQNVIIQNISDSGLYLAILQHMESDVFQIRKNLLIALRNLFSKTGPFTSVFVCDKLFSILREFLETDDKEITSIIVQIMVFIDDVENFKDEIDALNDYILELDYLNPCE